MCAQKRDAETSYHAHSANSISILLQWFKGFSFFTNRVATDDFYRYGRLLTIGGVLSTWIPF